MKNHESITTSSIFLCLIIFSLIYLYITEKKRRHQFETISTLFPEITSQSANNWEYIMSLLIGLKVESFDYLRFNFSEYIKSKIKTEGFYMMYKIHNDLIKSKKFRSKNMRKEVSEFARRIFESFPVDLKAQIFVDGTILQRYGTPGDVSYVEILIFISNNILSFGDKELYNSFVTEAEKMFDIKIENGKNDNHKNILIGEKAEFNEKFKKAN